jgi:dihydrodipicolinate synthase/N-acetylneuraminate lyase
VLRGALAASITPLRDEGAAIDVDGIGPVLDFLVAGGLDGLLALGTNGEGILLAQQERQLVAELFVEASAGRLQVAVHCGAQSTADTVALAAHAASIGADGVAVIPPPYYAFGPDAVLAHLAAAAAACEPVPFYPYAFAARSGYRLEPVVVERLRERVSNLAGLKVSEAPFDRVAPYLDLGLPVFVGAEPLIPQGLAAGAAGSVSGLAAAFPEIVRAVVDAPDDAGAARLGELRAAVERHPFQAALKTALGARGVPVMPDVRPPVEPLDADGAEAIRELVDATFVK